MHNHYYKDTDYNPIVWTREEYDAAIAEEKADKEAAAQATRRAKKILTCAAWFCLIMAVIAGVQLHDYVTAALNLTLAAAGFIALKTKLIEVLT